MGAWLCDNNTQSASLCSLWNQGALLTPAPAPPGVYTASCQLKHPGRVPHAVSQYSRAGPGYHLAVQPSNTTRAAGMGLCLLPGQGKEISSGSLYSPVLSIPALAALASLQQAGLSVWNDPSDGTEAVTGRDCHQASSAASLHNAERQAAAGPHVGGDHHTSQTQGRVPAH